MILLIERTDKFIDVDNVDNLSLAFQQIYDKNRKSDALNEQRARMHDSTYYSLFRIIAIMAIGAAIGLSLGLVFDNRHLARSFGIGGSVAGLIYKG